MAGLVVADTDFLIDFLRGKGDGARQVRTLIAESRMRVTAITAYELRVGVDFLRRRDEILRLLRSRTIPLDARCALRAGEVAAALRAEGRDIASADCLQAGVCLRWDLPFMTRNRKHFDRVRGLRLVPADA